MLVLLLPLRERAQSVYGLWSALTSANNMAAGLCPRRNMEVRHMARDSFAYASQAGGVSERRGRAEIWCPSNTSDVKRYSRRSLLITQFFKLEVNVQPQQ